ncbi:MAG: YebC/PmpR family DNA-binding transcriptional regulator [Candidatus Nomurabacteria bacterium]|nr:YebC/PmpR family DNA-binding transcriptional regulator [Candidatus Nomurabacteria bacterium]
MARPKLTQKKAAADARRSKMFGKLVRLIQVEAKLANGDVNSPALKTAIDKAHKENMPQDNIDRAIKKASEAGDTKSVMFEAYGPAGVGMIITGLTDNNNRTSAEIKNILSKAGASFGATGSVSWNFTKDHAGVWQPNTTVALSDEDSEKLTDIVDQLHDNDDVQDIYTSAE